MMKFMAGICDVMKTIGIGMIPLVLIGGLVCGLIFLITKFPWILAVLFLSGLCYIVGSVVRKDYNRIYQHLKDMKEDYERETDI